MQFTAACEARAAAGETLWVDPAKTSLGVFTLVQAAAEAAGRGKKRGDDGKVKAAVVKGRSPIQIAKAVKVCAVATHRDDA